MTLLVRAGTVLGGFLLLAVSVVLFFLPEVAVALAIHALGLIGREFRWAADAQAALLVRSAQMRDWFVRQPTWTRLAVSLGLALVLVAIVVLVFGH